MMKQTLRILFPVISLAALLLSACNMPATATPTQAVSAIYTAAAQTIAAEAAQATSTPQPTETAKPTNTPTVTVTIPATPVPPTSPAQNFCDNSIFIADVTIPDNTVLAPGQTFDKTWSFQNTGTCTWTEGYTIIFSNGDLMSGTTRSINQTVVPQQKVNVTVKLTAPTAPGTYDGRWRLTNGKGAPFGQFVSVVIVVSPGGGATTVTPTVATAPVITLTLTQTSAPVESATPIPTITVTPAP